MEALGDEGLHARLQLDVLVCTGRKREGTEFFWLCDRGDDDVGLRGSSGGDSAG
jgi:hypothetical protein